MLSIQNLSRWLYDPFGAYGEIKIARLMNQIPRHGGADKLLEALCQTSRLFALEELIEKKEEIFGLEQPTKGWPEREMAVIDRYAADSKISRRGFPTRVAAGVGTATVTATSVGAVGYALYEHFRDPTVFEVIERHANVFPVTHGYDSDKPNLFYVSMLHDIDGKYHAESAICQVELFHLLVDMHKHNFLGKLFWEGSTGNIAPNQSQVAEFNAPQYPHIDDYLLLDLFVSTGATAGNLMAIKTGFSEVYGAYSEKVRDEVTAEMRDVRWLLEKLTPQKGKEYIAFTRAEAEKCCDISSLILENGLPQTRESISYPLTIARGDEDIAIVMGYAHSCYLDDMRKNGELAEIDKHYNLFYIFPYLFTDNPELVEGDPRDHMKENIRKVCGIKEYMEKHDLATVLVHKDTGEMKE